MNWEIVYTLKWGEKVCIRCTRRTHNAAIPFHFNRIWMETAEWKYDFSQRSYHSLLMTGRKTIYFFLLALSAIAQRSFNPHNSRSSEERFGFKSLSKHGTWLHIKSTRFDRKRENAQRPLSEHSTLQIALIANFMFDKMFNSIKIDLHYVKRFDLTCWRTRSRCWLVPTADIQSIPLDYWHWDGSNLSLITGNGHIILRYIDNICAAARQSSQVQWPLQQLPFRSVNSKWSMFAGLSLGWEKIGYECA